MFKSISKLGYLYNAHFISQIEENTRALEYLGHHISGSLSSLDSLNVSTSSNAAAKTTANNDMKAEKWKQGARKTLLTWVTNAMPK